MLSCCSSCPRIPVGCSAHVPVAKSPTFSAASEACATRGGHAPQRDSTQQADIAEQICHALVRYPGYPFLPAWRVLARITALTSYPSLKFSELLLVSATLFSQESASTARHARLYGRHWKFPQPNLC